MKTSAGIEFMDGELEKMAQDRMYVVKGRTVYAAKYHENTGARLERVYTSIGELPLTKRGRFHVFNAGMVNNLLGFKLLI